jgi:hypothetical protein
VEIAASEVNGGKFIIGDGDTSWIGGLIKTTAYRETGIGAGGGNEFDDDLVGEQGCPRQFPAPMLSATASFAGAVSICNDKSSTAGISIITSARSARSRDGWGSVTCRRARAISGRDPAAIEAFKKLRQPG